jgi:hypothetical protein
MDSEIALRGKGVGKYRQIACVSQPVPAILPPGDFRPGHLFPSNLANPKESQPAEITQLLFQSASKTELEFALGDHSS